MSSELFYEYTAGIYIYSVFYGAQGDRLDILYNIVVRKRVSEKDKCQTAR